MPLLYLLFVLDFHYFNYCNKEMLEAFDHLPNSIRGVLWEG